MLLRTLILVAVLASGQMAVAYIERGYMIGEVVPPAQDIDQMPMELGSWTGRDVEKDERIVKYLQAQSGVDRIYRSPAGAEVSAHVVWTDDYIKVHFPEQCYKEAGWKHVSTQSIEIGLPEVGLAEDGAELAASNDVQIEADGHRIPARLLTFNRDGRATTVLYWFQMGDGFFFDRVNHRMLRRKVCWGNREWPPLVKVMLEAPTAGTRSENHLREVASEILAWMHDS